MPAWGASPVKIAQNATYTLHLSHNLCTPLDTVTRFHASNLN